MMTLYAADCRQNRTNCRYPHKVQVTDEASLRQAVERDYVCAKYREDSRSVANFMESDCLAFDTDNDHTDNPAGWALPDDVASAFPGVEFWVHYSRSNMKEKNGKTPRPKYHVLFPIDRCTDASAYVRMKQAVHELFPYVDENALDVARFFFGTEHAEVEFWGGVRNLTEFLRKQGGEVRSEISIMARETTASHDFGALSELNQNDSSGNMLEKGSIANYELRCEANPLGPIANCAPIPLGARNSTMHRFAVRVLKRYGMCDRARELFLTEAQRCDPPLGMKELQTIWSSAGKFFNRTIQLDPDYVPPGEFEQRGPSLRPPDYSDIGQAKVLAREYREELCFTEGTDYLRYDGSCWQESRQQAVGAVEEFLDLQLADADDEIGEAFHALREIGGMEFSLAGGMKGLDKQIGELGLSGEKLNALTEARNRLAEAVTYRAFVMKHRDMPYVLSALAAAKPMLQKNISDLDRNEFLLNTPSATYDLRQGMDGVQRHNPRDYITKITAVDPSDKGMEIWQEALETFFQGDKALIRYVQLIAGLIAVGKVWLEAILIAYGEGRNGKSTFWNTISHVLGSYSGQISADALTVGCKRNVKPEMAELKGKRFVIAAELGEGQRLNTSIIKQLCSTDEIFAEKKYKDPFSFVPSHTLVLYTNHLPKVGATDAGTWRRLIVIPFNAKLEGNSDIKNYTDYLVQNAGEAVLKWIIEGAREVIKAEFDLPFPPCVKDAISAYRDSNDWLTSFLEECCEVGNGYTQKSGELYSAYRDYCSRNGEYARNTIDFAQALEQAGFERKRMNTGKVFIGLRVQERNTFNEFSGGRYS